MAHGDFNHIEIPFDDEERAKAFYSGVFGWDLGQMPEFPEYDLFRVNVGGALGRRGVSAGQATRNYIEVSSIDAAVPKVQELGGAITQPKAEIPGQGWFAVGTDSEGNELALFEPLPRDG